MRVEKNPHLIILDYDLEYAPKLLPEKELIRQINASYILFLCIFLKFKGIANKNIYKQMVSMNHEILQTIYADYPSAIPKAIPNYKPKEFKWIKMCANHYDFVATYATSLLSEYNNRFKKANAKAKYIRWFIERKPPLPYVNMSNYTFTYPVNTLPRLFRKSTDYVACSREYFKEYIDNPLEEYNKTSVPDFFDLDKKYLDIG